MKKVILLLAVLAMSPVAFGAGLSGSAHDFTTSLNLGWSGGSVCAPCHAPHGNGDAGAPLWNHVSASGDSFTPYANAASLDAVPGDPSGTSLLCLSCHDGVTALDNFGSSPTLLVTMDNINSGAATIGQNLVNSHPISFAYTDSLASTDESLKTPSTDSSGLGGSIAADMLFDGNMECASCHDVHNSAGVDKLLVKSNAASALCVTCHTK